MDRDFGRQMARARGAAKAASLVQRAIRRDGAAEAGHLPTAGATYVVGRRRSLKAAVAEASAFPHAVDPVARDLAARRR
ncbi:MULTISPECIES: hypothetical protein [Inquilinus]|jgi:hypothetical protein|uniref:Uncharacterized protein n=1 Tax=Inquilinus ginsengisoli TaxID=363840 RepID=A0ABU1JIZ9_9PROT|nr:hypothetical protein [Inquilinus ginsengisoli]MDR6288586.1 hypothetical protein [Inquilinus ginsengisoli]